VTVYSEKEIGMGGYGGSFMGGSRVFLGKFTNIMHTGFVSD
jgi:hypothetical protein